MYLSCVSEVKPVIIFAISLHYFWYQSLTFVFVVRYFWCSGSRKMWNLWSRSFSVTDAYSDGKLNGDL